jgi:hypothetical protein
MVTLTSVIFTSNLLITRVLALPVGGIIADMPVVPQEATETLQG